MSASVLVSLMIRTLIQCVIGWILIEKVPAWLSISGFIATIIKVIGVLVILSALLAWI